MAGVVARRSEKLPQLVTEAEDWGEVFSEAKLGICEVVSFI